MAKLYSELERRLYVCVDSCPNSEPMGRIYSLITGRSEFGGVLAMLNKIEATLEQMKYPQPTHEMRSFTKKRRRKTQALLEEMGNGRENDEEEGLEGMAEMQEAMGMQEDTTMQIQGESGRQATFVISVKYRQNSTWQGKIQWIEAKKEQTFRSTLEMIKLMDSALATSQDKTELDGWAEP